MIFAVMLTLLFVGNAVSGFPAEQKDSLADSKRFEVVRVYSASQRSKFPVPAGSEDDDSEEDSDYDDDEDDSLENSRRGFGNEKWLKKELSGFTPVVKKERKAPSYPFDGEPKRKATGSEDSFNRGGTRTEWPFLKPGDKKDERNGLKRRKEEGKQEIPFFLILPSVFPGGMTSVGLFPVIDERVLKALFGDSDNSRTPGGIGPRLATGDNGWFSTFGLRPRQANREASAKKEVTSKTEKNLKGSTGAEPAGKEAVTKVKQHTSSMEKLTA